MKPGDMRTPLSTLMGMVQLLRTTNLDEKQREYVNIINQSCHRLLELYESSDSIAPKDSKAAKATNVIFSLDGMLNELKSIYDPIARDKGIRFSIGSVKKIQNHLIGDSYRIYQALSIILENAIKHTTDGQVDLKVNHEYKSAYELILTFEIQDSGPGIKSNETFYFDSFDEMVYLPGSGLTTAYYLLEILGARLVISSDPINGTNIKIVTQCIMQKEDVSTKVIEDHIPVAVPFRKKKILIAEDEIMNRLTFKIALKDSYDLIFAKNGKEALDFYYSDCPDLVIMDIMMPGMDGFQVLDEIEKKGRKKNLPIVACTARIVDSEPDYLMGIGFNDFLSKPVTTVNLKTIIDKYL